MIVNEGKKPLFVGCFMVFASLIVLPSTISSVKTGDWKTVFTYTAFVAVAATIGVIIALRSNRVLTLTKKECSYRNMFTKVNAFQFADIAKVEVKKILPPIPSLIIILYDKNGKKLGKVEEIMNNWAEALEFLEKSNIEISGISKG